MERVLINPSAPASAALLPLLLCKQLGWPYDFIQTADKATPVKEILGRLPPFNSSEFGWLLNGDDAGLSPSTPFSKLKLALNKLSSLMAFKTYMDASDRHAGLADYYVFGCLRGSTVWAKVSKDWKDEAELEHVLRWWSLMNTRDALIREASAELQLAALSLKKPAKDQASYDIDLKDAKEGEVVTRFPPEPSGYLHIGHAKAALLNDYFARRYRGSLILRFDDTNPAKESGEFEDAIRADLSLLQITPDRTTYTSDYFGRLLEVGEEMLRQGLAYADDTPQEQMRQERGAGIPSKRRDQPVQDNLRMFQEMRAGSELGLQTCIRAKISVDATNKAMRDPVILRCCLTPHHRTGSRFHVYPTYDFACPCVDSWEGVTHALRTSEYHDRNAQYAWFQEALNLRKVHIWDYSRMNFVHTLLSKRHMAWFVREGRVGGWDDPRLPTIRGILRRGLQVSALREYILMQGPSKNTLLLEWDKLWAVNKKVIDPVAPKHTALTLKNLVTVRIDEAGLPQGHPREKPSQKNPAKTITFADEIFLEQADAQECRQGEHVTLMEWGNAIIKEISKKADGSNVVESMSCTLDLQGDFKSTAKKLTWLPTSSSDASLPSKLFLHDYDYLISKKKLEEDDKLQDWLVPQTEYITECIGDHALKRIAKGQVVQLERKGYFICDRNDDGAIHLVAIPDGRTKSTALKTTAPVSTNSSNASS